MWVRPGSRCAEGQRVRGSCCGHCRGNSQGVRQEPCTQSFGEILGEGQRRLKTEGGKQDKREIRERDKMISSRRSAHVGEMDIDLPFQTLLICHNAEVSVQLT